MIIEEYDESMFMSRFEDYKRVNTLENPNGNFSYKGLRHLFNYLDDLSEDTGENIKLDVIALCCEFNEYKDLNEYLRDYSNKYNLKEITGKEAIESLNDEELTELKEVIQNDLNENTTLIKFGEDLNEGFIIAGY